MLDPAVALKLARRLTTVTGFPNYQEAIEATAEDLIDLTGNAPTSDEAESRARWLVGEIRQTWTQWTGTSDLVQMYRRKFDPAPPPGNAFKDHPRQKPKIECSICNDTGAFQPGADLAYQWCECQTGINLHFDLPDWLEYLNGKFATRTVVRMRDIEEEIGTNPIHPSTEREIEPQPDCPACTAKRKHNYSEYVRHHVNIVA